MESSVSNVDLAIEQMSQSHFSNNSIDTVVTSINEVVNDAARKCFATKNCKKKIIIEIVDLKDGLIRIVRRQKRVTIICKNLQRFPKDPIVRGRYHKLKKNNIRGLLRIKNMLSTKRCWTVLVSERKIILNCFGTWPID